MDDPRAAVHSLVRRSLGPTQPVKAVAGYVAKSMRPEEAFRATLSDCLAQITANAATLRTSADGSCIKATICPAVQRART